jgi:predicted DsbA family dithiol-disulfide isomerase
LYRKTYPGGKSDTFKITWRPYYLGHNPLPYAVEKSEVRKIKFEGVSTEKMAAMSSRIEQIGRSLGINFKHEGKIGPTRDAHRLILLSESKGHDVTDALVENIFEAYHELERDISNREVLKELAVRAGLDALEVDEWLVSDAGGEQTDRDARANRDIVNSGVPHFIVQGENLIDGAQDPGDFLEVFIKVRDEQDKQ